MKYFFVTGMGRSGTKFLAALLQEINGVHSEHEFIGNREFWTLSHYLPHDVYAIPYLEKTKNEIENSFHEPVFIDINSMLHHCVPALEEVFKPAVIFHLVRDPRSVIRSLYSRRSDKNIHIVPKTKPGIEKWLKSDKFYQVCWNWNDATQKLLSENTTLIRFEDLLSDYDYFNRNILQPSGMSLPIEQWSKTVSHKVNETKPKVYRFVYARLRGKDFVEDELPAFEEWPDSLKKTMYDTCGETMKACGYL